MDAWYLGRDGRQLGPYRWRVIEQLATAGKLSPRDFLWTQGMAEWARVATFPQLQPAPAPEPIPPETDRRRRSYFVRHWRGQLSLPVSYWINGSLATVIAIALTLWIGQTDTVTKLGAFGTGAWLLAMLTSLYAMTVWQFTGIWRSATRHTSRGGSGAWAVAARVMVVIGVIGTLQQAVEQYPLWKQATLLVAGREDVPRSQFRVLNGATELELSGGLTFGTASALQTLLEATPSIRIVHLNNDGGWISEGLQVEKLIRDHQLVTATETECVSACLMAFLGGRERLLASGARLGFHQASVAGFGGASASGGNEQFREFFRSKGLPEDFIRKALSAPPNDMWYPTDAELVAANVVTGILDQGAEVDDVLR